MNQFNCPFEIVKTTMGATSIKDCRVGEILHNPVGPWVESRSLYVGQTRLREKLYEANPEPLVLYDVGLGAGFNVMAALEALDQEHQSHNQKKRKLVIISFENDLSLFEFAIKNINQFAENLPFKGRLQHFFQKHILEEENLSWKLYPSFPEDLTDDLPKAELVFFDLYSPKFNGSMWSLETFQKLRDHMNESSSNSLVTYSVATAIRTGLLLAGFYVGRGIASGLKKETTVASTRREVSQALDDKWLERWLRSDHNIPQNLSGLTRESVWEQLTKHPQFSPFYLRLAK